MLQCVDATGSEFRVSRGKERNALRDSDMRDVAAKMSFKVDHGSPAFETGEWVQMGVHLRQ